MLSIIISMRRGWMELEHPKKHTIYEYLLHRFLVPERNVEGELLLMLSQLNPDVCIPVSRFQIMFRLCQIYLVDVISA